MKKRINFRFLAFNMVMALFCGGCGVKGDPVPPEKPEEIGRGRPTLERLIKNPVPKKDDDKIEVKK